MLRKLNDTEYQYDTDNYVDIEITKEGILFDSNEELTWQEIAKARNLLGLVSFTDEDFIQWQQEQENKGKK